MSGDGKIVIDYESRMGAVMRDQAELNRSIAKLNEQVTTLDKGAKQSGGTFATMQRSATRLYAEEATAVEKLKQKLLETNALYKQGHIDKVTAAQRTDRINKELLKYDEQHQKSLLTETKILQTKQRTEQEIQTTAMKYAAANETADVKRRRALLELNALKHQGILTEAQHTAEVAKLSVVSESTFSRMTVGAGKAALATVGIATAAGAALKAISLINEEIEAGNRRNQSAAQQLIGERSATRNMLLNLGTDPSMTPAQLIAERDKIALDTGADRTAVTNDLASALSAKANLPASSAVASVRAVRTMDSATLGGAEMAGAALDIEKRTGMKPEQSIGYLAKGAQQARVTEFGQYTKNIAPAIMNLMAMGLTIEEAFELTSSATQESTDKTGASSGTGSLQFAEQIYESTANAGMAKDASFTERRNFLLKDPKGIAIRKEMLGVWDQDYDPTAAKSGRRKRGGKVDPLHGEVREKSWMIGMLSPGSDIDKRYGATQEAIGNAGSAGQFYQDMVNINTQIPSLAVGTVDEIFNGLEQSIDSSPGRGMTGVVTSRMPKILDKLGVSPQMSNWVVDKIRQVELNGSTPAEAVRAGEQELRSLASPPAQSDSFMWDPFGFAKPEAAAPDSRLIEAADRLNEAAKNLNNAVDNSTPRPNGPRPPMQQPVPSEP